MSACLLRAADDQQLTPGQRDLNVQSFELIWATLRDHYWDAKMNGVDWQKARDRLRREVSQASTMPKARAAMDRMLALLDSSHLAIIPAAFYKKSRSESRASKPEADVAQADDEALESASAAEDKDGSTGIGVTTLEKRIVVQSVEAGSPAAAAGVLPGWTITAVDGIKTEWLLMSMQDVHTPERDAIINASIRARLSGAVDSRVRVELVDGKGQALTREMARTGSKGKLVRLGYLPPSRVWLESRTLDSGAGYIRLNLFLDPVSVMPEFERAVRSMMHAPGIVLDLRDNSGGIGIMAMGIAGWFVPDQGKKLGTMTSRDLTLKFVINPRIETYTGPLAILVDSGSASTTEILAQGLQDLKRTRVFGTRTAGAALASQFVRLPNRDRFQYPEANYVSENGRTLEKNGVIPDVEVSQTIESLLGGKDLPLEAAAEWIKRHEK